MFLGVTPGSRSVYCCGEARDCVWYSGPEQCFDDPETPSYLDAILPIPKRVPHLTMCEAKSILSASINSLSLHRVGPQAARNPPAHTDDLKDST